MKEKINSSTEFKGIQMAFDFLTLSLNIMKI